MKTVAIVTNSLSGGGAERAMNLLADSLGKREELDIMLIPINAGPRDLVEPHCRISEIGRIWNGGIWETVKAFLKFQFLLIQFRPKYLILNCDLPEFYSAFAIWNSECVIVEHTTRPWHGRRRLGYFVRLILQRRGAVYVRVSERIISFKNSKSSIVIPNIIDPEVVGKESGTRIATKSERRLIFIGRLSEEKRPDLFVDLARESGLQSIIIGDGQLRSQLQKSSQLVRNLNFLGQQMNPWEWVTNNDLVVVTSEYEGDGLVALEAISIGLPIALRKTSDLLKIGLPEKNYFEDVSSLVERLKGSDFLEFEVGSAERDQILKNRNPKVVTEKWLNLIFSSH